MKNSSRVSKGMRSTAVVQVDVVRARDDHEVDGVGGRLVDVLGVVERVRVGAGHEENLARGEHVQVGHQREGEEGHGGGGGPRGGGVDRAGVVAALGAVVVVEGRQDRVGVRGEGFGEDVVGLDQVAGLVEGDIAEAEPDAAGVWGGFGAADASTSLEPA